MPNAPTPIIMHKQRSIFGFRLNNTSIAQLGQA